MAACNPHTDTAAPPSVKVSELIHCAAPPKFWPKRVSHAPGEKDSVLKSAPFTTLPMAGAGGARLVIA
jgi:hypothetical protein